MCLTNEFMNENKRKNKERLIEDLTCSIQEGHATPQKESPTKGIFQLHSFIPNLIMDNLEAHK